jgi:hypothetical protein
MRMFLNMATEAEHLKHTVLTKKNTIVKISIILSLCVNKISKRRKNVHTSNQK